MLDWDGRSYECDGRKTGPISKEFRHEALRTEDAVFSPESDEQFVRGAFDELFDGFERLEHFVRIDLIKFEDVENPFAYYVSKMASPNERAIVTKFLKVYNFGLAPRFLSRFPTWGGTPN